jgi:beta-N-acetylhexosaminidase
MSKMFRHVISGLLVLGLVTIGQNQVCLAVDKRKADIRGTITSVSLTDEKKNLGRLRVEGKIESDTGFDKAMIRVTATTKLEKWLKGKLVSASISEFKEGCQVEAGFEGPIAESYPVQVNAGWLLLLEKK